MRDPSLVFVMGRYERCLTRVRKWEDVRDTSLVIVVGRNDTDTMPYELAFMKLDCFSVVFCKNHLQAIEERIRVLERFQDNSVDAILEKIVQTASSKNFPFCKHYSNRFSSSRLWPWRAGTTWPVIFRPFPVIERQILVSGDQFRRYLLILLGDKE